MALTPLAGRPLWRVQFWQLNWARFFAGSRAINCLGSRSNPNPTNRVSQYMLVHVTKCCWRKVLSAESVCKEAFFFTSCLKAAGKPFVCPDRIALLKVFPGLFQTHIYWLDTFGR